MIIPTQPQVIEAKLPRGQNGSYVPPKPPDPPPETK